MIVPQGITEPLSSDEGTELSLIKKPRNTTMSYTPKSMGVTMGEPATEKTMPFGMLKNNNSGSNQLTDNIQSISRVTAKGCTEIKTATNQNGKYAYTNSQVSVALLLCQFQN